MIEGIVSIICEYFEISVEDIHKKTREREYVFPRQMAHYFACFYSHYSLSVIGQRIGNKDHATVLHGKNVVIDLMDSDKEVKNQVDDIHKIIKKNLTMLNNKEIVLTEMEIKEAVVNALIVIVTSKIEAIKKFKSEFNNLKL